MGGDIINRTMSKKTIVMSCVTIGMVGGGFLPWVFGDRSLVGGWEVLGGLLGGIAGIWLGTKIAKNIG